MHTLKSLFLLFILQLIKNTKSETSLIFRKGPIDSKEPENETSSINSTLWTTIESSSLNSTDSTSDSSSINPSDSTSDSSSINPTDLTSSSMSSTDFTSEDSLINSTISLDLNTDSTRENDGLKNSDIIMIVLIPLSISFIITITVSFYINHSTRKQRYFSTDKVDIKLDVF